MISVISVLIIVCAFRWWIGLNNYRINPIFHLQQKIYVYEFSPYALLWHNDCEMERQGMITRNGRSVTIHSRVQSDSRMSRVPILGNISCGSPEYAEENYEEYVPLPAALFGEGEFFILRARGSSMIEAGIEKGDLVVVRKQNHADEGDIIVALVNNETTLKRFYVDKEKKCVRLHPENRSMKDILVKDCYIQGVAQHVIKVL